MTVRRKVWKECEFGGKEIIYRLVPATVLWVGNGFRVSKIRQGPWPQGGSQTGEKGRNLSKNHKDNCKKYINETAAMKA